MPADAAPPFLLVAELPSAGAKLTLPEDESHYLTRVCRVRPGERATATDGRGGLGVLRVLEGGRRAVVEVESCERARPARAAWVLAGAPEGERGDWMVEKLAELGVAVFQPIDCERGCWERMKGRSDRWQRLAVAALRQSRRRFLLEVRAPQWFAEAMAGLPAGAGSWLADAAGPPAATLTPPREGVAIGLIGPAAGLAPAERQVAEARHFRPISLSDSRLRAETAALAWASWWSGGAAGSPARP
ncbi:MAG: RsmE family RNA methyltransferase [Candidatus Eisenbacteria bacterium]